MASIHELVVRVLPEATSIRHDLHAHPQLGYQEDFASALVQSRLREWGIPFQAGLAETGVVAWIEPECCPASAAAVGLRADMDALPITEATGLPYESVHPGRMHACGHDGHTSVLLGAAWVLQQIRSSLPTPVKLIFQPAEEVGAGAQRMIDDGALSSNVGGRPVACMFGLHGSPSIPVGHFATRTGAVLAGCTDFEIAVCGSGGHAAMPHLASDPLLTAAHVVTVLQSLVTRNNDPSNPALISVGTFHGGTATNVIPDRVQLTGTLRASSPQDCARLQSRLIELVKNTARAFGCDAEVRFASTYPPVMNNANSTAFAFDVAERICGRERVHRMDSTWMGSEDFAFYSHVVPSTFGFYGLIPNGRNSYPMLHTPQFDFADAALETGIRFMCEYAVGAERLI